jgi:hypothetical protein
MDIQPVDTFVREGFAKKMTEQFRAPTLFVTSPDVLPSMKTALGNQTPSYPYIELRQQSVSDNPDAYVTHRLVRQGLAVQYSKNQFDMVRILPANFTVEATFVTNRHSSNDTNSVDGFVRRALFARRNGSLSFQINYGMTVLPITYTIDGNISTPPRESPTDLESVYKTVLNIVVHGYVSEPSLGNRGRVQQVYVGQQVVTPGGINNTQFIPFASS